MVIWQFADIYELPYFLWKNQCQYDNMYNEIVLKGSYVRGDESEEKIDRI